MHSLRRSQAKGRSSCSVSLERAPVEVEARRLARGTRWLVAAQFPPFLPCTNSDTGTVLMVVELASESRALKSGDELELNADILLERFCRTTQ